MPSCSTCGRAWPDDHLVCPMDGSRLNQTAENVVRTSRTVRLAAGNPAKPFRVEPGLKVGEYVITEKVASGGMGSIYSAQHPILGKRAAIKMVKAELSSDPEVLARFVREAQAVNLIQHPNIIDVFSIGALPDGRPYFVMEWLEGENLAQRIARSPAPSLTDVAAILLPVIDAIAAAHAAGIVHRDLKPSNIFLAQRRGAMVVKVVDFGIAKLRGKPGGDTRTGVVIGTPAYLAPEQWKSSKVDHRADVYALGVVAFELLTGERPSDVDTDTLPGVGKSPSSLSAIRPDVPPGIDHVITRMMSDDPTDRPPLAELASVLAASGARESTPAVRAESTGAAPLPVGELALAPTARSGTEPARGGRRVRPWLLGLGGAGIVGATVVVVAVASHSGNGGGGVVVAEAPRDAATPMRADAAEAAMRADASVGEVQFEIRADVDGARIELDGRFVSEGVRSTSIRAPAGDHDIVVTAPGRVTFRQHARAGAGATVAIQAELPATRGREHPTLDRPASAATVASRVRALYRKTGVAVDQLVGKRDDAVARELQSAYLAIASPFATDDPQQLRDIEQRLDKLSSRLR